MVPGDFPTAIIARRFRYKLFLSGRRPGRVGLLSLTRTANITRCFRYKLFLYQGCRGPDGNTVRNSHRYTSNNWQFQFFFLLIFHALFLLQLLQRFRLEYHHEPLEMRQKLLTAPDKPVKIKFVDRV